MRPITLIVPFPAGGGVDTIARVIAQKLSSALTQKRQSWQGVMEHRELIWERIADAAEGP